MRRDIEKKFPSTLKWPSGQGLGYIGARARPRVGLIHFISIGFFFSSYKSFKAAASHASGISSPLVEFSDDLCHTIRVWGSFQTKMCMPSCQYYVHLYVPNTVSCDSLKKSVAHCGMYRAFSHSVSLVCSCL